MRVGNLVLALFLPWAAALSATAPSQATDYQLKGWNLQVSLDPEKASYVQGEPIYVYFTIHNNSAEDLQVIVGGDDMNELNRPERFKVLVTRGNGSAIPARELPPVVPRSGNRTIGPQKIPARGSYRFSLLVADWANLREPGEYSITASRILDLQKYSQSDMSRMEDPSSLEHLEARATGTFALAPFDRATLGAVIDARGRTMLQETKGLGAYTAAEAAANAMAQIDDDRVVPYFRRVVLELADTSMLLTAIRALARFNNDTALDTLVQATRSPKDGTRHAAAVSLSKSLHPGAINELLKLRSDPFQGVRNTVLQTLSRMQTPESLQMIREMTNDGYEPLRVEALRYLRLRTEGMKP